jgi:hypothetical protein
MVDTEVWVPPGLLYDEWIDKELILDAGPITEYGRYIHTCIIDMVY